jgi:hypothetical protein
VLETGRSTPCVAEILTVVLAVLAAAASAAGDGGKAPAGSRIVVDASRVRHVMQGGLGASWHALVHDVPLENEKYDYPVRFTSPRGSAWGGNPPLENAAAWEDLYRHARWLGLSFLRVEIDQRMYEPERGRFDFASDEMRVLFRILDWAEKEGADVFLQQMWRHVGWNAFPGVHPLLSAPRSLEEHASGFAALVEHLTKTRGYTCIRWLSIANEPPGGTWGYWWSAGSWPCPSLASGLATVRAALDARRVALPLSAPDWTDLPPFDAGALDFDSHVGAYDIHTYRGLNGPGQKVLDEWVAHARSRGKPLLVTEFGNMSHGWGGDHPGPRTFPALLSNAEVVIRALRSGVDALNRWSFTNRGDLDGQWQIVRTWDPKARAHLERVTPEPVPYFGFGLLTRFFARHSSVVEARVETEPSRADELLAAAVKSPRGRLTVFVLNQGKDGVDAPAEFAGTGDTLFLYQVEEKDLVEGAAPAPKGRFAPSEGPRTLSLPARSLTVVTAFDLRPGEPGIVRDEALAEDARERRSTGLASR